MNASQEEEPQEDEISEIPVIGDLGDNDDPLQVFRRSILSRDRLGFARILYGVVCRDLCDGTRSSVDGDRRRFASRVGEYQSGYGESGGCFGVISRSGRVQQRD